jgi:hypothetical protein|eukprot:SAG25_NODE_1191_length_3655_cov_7.039651_4_plen_188_part_00
MCMSRSFENSLVKYNFTDKAALVEFLTVRLLPLPTGSVVWQLVTQVLIAVTTGDNQRVAWLLCRALHVFGAIFAWLGGEPSRYGCRNQHNDCSPRVRPLRNESQFAISRRLPVCLKQVDRYCSQEIVNLMLTGRAHSNVFDGQLEGVMENPMKGIYERCQVFGCLLPFASFDVWTKSKELWNRRLAI